MSDEQIVIRAYPPDILVVGDGDNLVNVYGDSELVLSQGGNQNVVVQDGDTLVVQDPTVQIVEVGPRTGLTKGTRTVTLSAMTSGEGRSLSVELPASCIVHRIAATRTVRVRWYLSAGQRTADIDRPVGMYPSNPDHGLVGEISGVSQIELPKPTVLIGDTPTHLRIDNQGPAGDVQVTFHYLALG